MNETATQPGRTLKQVDAARTLGVTERTLRTWTKERGWFTPVKRGGVLLYDAEQIRRFQKPEGVA
jgi:DNA-binding transcriptional MerR regulator